MSGFLTPLQLEFEDGHFWKVVAPFEYHLGDADGPEFVDIPVGFQTDFASIPRLLWNILPPDGLYGKAAVVHDWLYKTRLIRLDCDICAAAKRVHSRLCDRYEADRVFLEGMEVLGVGWLTRHVIYRGVRLGGWWAWQQHRRHDG